MSGPARDLAVVDHWNASLERSRERRARSSRRLLRRPGGAPQLQSTLLAHRGLPRSARDLADFEPWELSLGRSRARRRAAELQFVPASSRAKRASLGALVAFTVGPTASVASGQSTSGSLANPTEPTTTTEHAIVLSFGSEGRQVKLLQEALGGIKVDGVFGPETEAAVRSFQTSRGLTVDGVVGPHTGAALRAKVAASRTFSANIGNVLPTSAAAIAKAVPAVDSSQSAVSGATSGGSAAPSASSPEPAVAAATSPESAAAEPAGAATDAEEAGGVQAPSLEEPETTTAATGQSPEAQAEAQAEAPAVAAATAQASTEAAAQEQSTIDAVRQLQSALHLSADGIFGPETEAAVRRLQARHGLAVDGLVGPQTWGVIGVRGQATLTPPPSALPTPTPTQEGAATQEGAVNTGDAAQRAGSVQAPPSGAEAVRWLQEALHLPVDGEFGPETEAAVQRLQARHGLTVDGVVGPATWALIGVREASTLTPPPSARIQVAASTTTTTGAVPSEVSSDSTTSAGYGATEGVVQRVIAAGDEIATRPYVWGGGHGSFESYGYDCSGSVSYALHGGGLLSSPEDSTELESYGEAGPGRYITIYANSEHAFMVVDGKRFDTVALAETGDRWSNTMTSTAGFVARHPDGL
jgi:peptidoglycan hydrolase-like protein with peptidoglycan-binding domain